MNTFNIPSYQSQRTQAKLDELQNATNNLTYTDIYDLLYGKK